MFEVSSLVFSSGIGYFLFLVGKKNMIAIGYFLMVIILKVNCYLDSLNGWLWIRISHYGRQFIFYHLFDHKIYLRLRKLHGLNILYIFVN